MKSTYRLLSLSIAVCFALPALSWAAAVHDDGTFRSADGTLSLYEQSWRPEGGARAVLILVHGFKDHSGRYARLAERAAARGIAVYAYDQRGHGHSEGARVRIKSFDEYLDDLNTFYIRVQAREPGKPVFLMGHSMGGAVSALFAIRDKPRLAGLVLSAPALAPGKSMLEDIAGELAPEVYALLSDVKEEAVKFLGEHFPNAPVFGLKCELMSHDPDVQEACRRTDPLVYHPKAPARTASEVLRAMDRIRAGEGSLRLPLLALHGGDDHITDPDGSADIVAKAGSADKTLKLLDGAYHDIFHELPNWTEAAETTLLDWLEERAPRG